MSLELVTKWVESTLRSPRARDEAITFFGIAASNNSEATLIAGPLLTTKRKCYMARWTGHELLVTELTDRQQHSFGVPKDAMHRQLKGSPPMPELPPRPCVTLSEVRLNTSESCGVSEPISGECRCSFDDPTSSGFLFCALRAEYFRPDLSRQGHAYFYVDEPIVPPSGVLLFRFASVSSLFHSTELRGAIVLFLELFTASDWSTRKGIHRISNTVSVSIEIH